MLIACIDILTGFEQAINAIFPKTEVQSSVVNQIRNSLKYAASKNQKEFLSKLKPVYRATSKKLAELNLEKPGEKWRKKGCIPSDDALLKLVYLTYKNISKE